LSTPSNPALGAFLGYLAIFFPGIIIKVSLLPIWRKMRTMPLLNAALKGVECGAVGLVYTAVYRLWRIGLINKESQQGSSIDNEPWFVVISAIAFISCRWYKGSPPLVIVLGGLLGMAYYGVIRQ
jgi:chromate transport protein ChrA